MFDFIQGVYAGEGAETMWDEPEVFMRGMWKALAVGNGIASSHWWLKRTRKKYHDELVYWVRLP